MNVNDIFPSRFVKAHDLGDKEITVTVKSATMEDMGHGVEKETKLCIWFERATKGFVLNKTNAMIIASMYGPETDNWPGKAITIYSARVKAFGAWHDAVRVKEEIPARNVGAAKIPDAMQEAPPLDDEEDLLDVDEGHTDVEFGMGNSDTSKATADRFSGLETADAEGDSASGQQSAVSSLQSRKYAAIIDSLAGDCLARANRARTLHAQSRGPSKPEQYQFLAGTIDDIVKQPHAHNAILEVFVGRAVNSGNPPGISLASKMLDALLEERTAEKDGEKVKEVNPNYDPKAVSCIHTIYSLVREADGQASLFAAEAVAK